MPESMLPAAKIPYSRPFSAGLADLLGERGERDLHAAEDGADAEEGHDEHAYAGDGQRGDVLREASDVVARTAGWVRRWAANSRPPTSVSAASVISPAAGCTPVHRAVASSGPKTKVNSSVTDSKAAAVGIRGEPWSFERAQRARTIGPICGTEAPVGTAASEQRPQRGVRQRERRQGRDGRVCTQDAGQQYGALAEAVGELAALKGANSAMETPVTAATAPALPYEPVVCCTSRTMEMVSIAKGCRAAKPGSRNVQAPGVRSSCP